MTTIIDQSYFAELKNANPEELCKAGRCMYLADKQRYFLEVWGNTYMVDPTNEKIDHLPADGPPLHEYFDLFVVYYLLRVKNICVKNQWVSEKDLPGGTTFFRGPHLIPTDRITKRFGNDLQGFKTWCKTLGGSPIDLADAAYRFLITPEISVAVLYWTGDDDFPAEAKVLYDRAVADGLTLDIVYALGVGVCSRLGRADIE